MQDLILLVERAAVGTRGCTVFLLAVSELAGFFRSEIAVTFEDVTELRVMLAAIACVHGAATLARSLKRAESFS